MNRAISRRFIAVSAASAVLFAAMTTVSVSAQSSSGQSVICSQLESRTQSIQSGFTERKDKYDVALQDTDARRTTGRSERDAALTKVRTSADTKRNQAYDALLSTKNLAADDANFIAYKTGVEQAVTTRRAAYDTARNTFYSQVDAQVVSRRQQSSQAILAFQTSANEALANAQSVCKRGREGLATIRSDFVGKLQTARLAYADFRRQATDDKADIQALIEARDQAYEAALAAFQASMSDLRASTSF